jgi:hypothetical protein
MNILELQKQIVTFLKTKSTRVYFEEAPDNATYPYVVYNLPNSISAFNREDFSLEIDVWDNVNNTTALETLVGNIDGNGDLTNPTGLNYKNIYVSNKLAATFYRESRLIIRDEDKRIKRRQLRYRIKTYLIGG